MCRSSETGILTYTFHPYVIGRGHRMLMLETLIERLEELGAKFMAMEDAADMFASERRDIPEQST